MSSRRSGASAATALSLGLCAALFFAGACSSSSSHPPNATGGGTLGGGAGGSSEEGGASDAGTSDIDGGNCLNGVFNVDADTGLGGTNQIAGTVQFSQDVMAGHSIVLTLTNTTNVSITYADTFSFPTTKSDFTFRLRNIPDGTYALLAQADIAGSSGVLDPGDLDGYFGGTTVAPIHTRADSTTITVPACRAGTEFGIGPK